jgi:hypothetical protein
MPNEKELEKKIKVLEQQLSEKEKIIKDPSKRGYFALCRILYQQIEYLDGFTLKDQIGIDPKLDKVFDRAKALWEGLTKMIIDCRALKQELNISLQEEEKEMKKLNRITPETMSNVLGNTAGQVSQHPGAGM